jgi:acetyl esterase/lipase
VIYHGGCWKTGIASQACMAPLATRWQQQGIATLNVDYREVGDGGGWPGSFADWSASTKLIDEVVARYSIDRDRVTLVGHSAGALPVLWLARADSAAGPLGERPALKARAGIVLDGPGDVGAERADFDALCQFSAVTPFMGADAARFAAISPATAAPQLPEVLFVLAKLPAPSAATQAALAAGGARLSVRENPGASHFAIITPGDPLYAAHEAAMLSVIRAQNDPVARRQRGTMLAATDKRGKQSEACHRIGPLGRVLGRLYDDRLSYARHGGDRHARL